MRVEPRFVPPLASAWGGFCCAGVVTVILRRYNNKRRRAPGWSFPMKLYNTMTMKKEEFVPVTPGRVTIYACGPTVYNYFHVGNARPIIMFDALRRYLEYRGYEVVFVQNFTDVDDKIIIKSHEEGIVEPGCRRESTSAEYFKDAQWAGRARSNRPSERRRSISLRLSVIITAAHRQRPRLCFRGRGCILQDRDVSVTTASCRTSRWKICWQGRASTSVRSKESPMDFALWKAAKPGEPFWPSPWGDGRPGWHIECSAMSGKYLGQTIDIHCGGQDLTFPHHENEIAQSEGASGVQFVRYWLHNGFISIDNRKMSKSLGNFFTVREAAEAYGYENIRMFMLMSHYRSPLNYSGDILLQAKGALDRLKTLRDNLRFLKENGGEVMGDSERAFRRCARRPTGTALLRRWTTISTPPTASPSFLSW